MYRILLLVSVWYISQVMLVGQNINYQNFDNIILDTEASSINCFAQDKQGIIWIGSSKGLFSYNGYTARNHFSYNNRSNTQVHCILVFDDTYLYLGTDNGILKFNCKTDQYEDSEALSHLTDVRAIAQQGDLLWIGSLNGLYKYRISGKKLDMIPTGTVSGLPHKTIYSLIVSKDNTLYAGTYDGLARLQTGKSHFETVKLPVDRKRSNLFINSLFEDKKTGHIWIGTEGALYNYIPASGIVSETSQFHDNSVKSLSVDNEGDLLVATDNGLYIYNEANSSTQHIVHDSRNSKSLSNNIVWNIFADNSGNIWLGTDYGISLAHYNRDVQTISISQLTGIGEGNRFHSIFKDSRGNFWFGGSNGLIFDPDTNGSTKKTIWYRMGDKEYPISHNRIRHIYEDKDHNLWIATDGSISRYDYNRNQFVHYSITDSTGTFNSNWAYYIFEDDKRQLWIATCLGGLFVVNKDRLIASQGTYVADKHYSAQNGLSGNFINQILPDSYGNVWALLHNNGIIKININNNRIDKIPIDDIPEGTLPNYLISDRNGIIWVGYRGGVASLNPVNNISHAVRFTTFSYSEVLSMTEVGEHIWVSTTEGIWVVNRKTYSIQKLDITNRAYTCSYYDKETNRIYMGGADQYTILSPDILQKQAYSHPVVLTSLYVNDKLYESGTDYTGNSIRYLDHIKLNYRQNSITIEFSDLLFSERSANSYVYKLEGFEDKWNGIRHNSNRISYTNLEYGKYELVISKLDAYGKPSDNAFTFRIEITPPWYYTIWAKTLYVLLALGLILWIINFFRVRNNLRIERIEKEKTLELSNLKMDFFTNVSHEFKTPLSMIIAPVSKLLHETKDVQKKRQLETIQKNALKINSLIRQILDFNRTENISSGLILSRVEFVEFARSLFSVYEDGYKDKPLSFIFTSNKEKIYIYMDVLKIEAVLNNLVSNACKYTERGAVSLTLTYNEDTRMLDIEVSDTGIGIPQDETTYVFERFYQSSKTSKDKEGTGIGLYLVKTYTDQHNGTVKISSEENKGTTIIVSLPANDDDPEEVIAEEETDTTPLSEDLPSVLIVEDNPEIAGFVFDTLSEKYNCRIAHNGKQGLDICLQTLPQLVIADIMMPVMDGLEMIRQMRKNIPTSTIPVIMLTAKDDKNTELESISLHVDAFIPKPFDPEILLSKAEQLLSSKQQLESKLRIETISTPQAIEATSPDEKFLSSITRIIEDKVADPDLNVNSLSTISGIGSKQIYRKLKQLTGMSPVEYIRKIRMKKAAILFTQNKFTIAEVMYMVGFSNPSYFAKCFQAEFGKTPKQFLEENT